MVFTRALRSLGTRRSTAARSGQNLPQSVRRLLAGFAAVALGVSLTISGALPASAANIQGTVNGPGGVGLAGITVKAFAIPMTSANPAFAKSTTTSPTGTFDLTGMSAGKYIVLFEGGSGLAPAWSAAGPTGVTQFRSEAQTVTLTTTGPPATIPIATLAATGAISGSAPSSWTVRALLWNPHTLTFENTNYQVASVGTYSLSGLPPGEYLVRFFSNVAGVPVDHWKSSIRTSQGTAVEVEAGQTASGISWSGATMVRTTNRIAGTSRWDANAQMSQAGFHNPETVFVASGVGYSDGLPAAAAAAVLGGPLLLANTTSLPDEAADELKRLKPKTVVLVGGEASLSPGVKTAIQDAVPAAQVIRIAGSNRYDGSRQVARYAFSGYDNHTAYVVTGEDFVDGMTAGSAAAIQHAPLILDNPALALDEATKSLVRELGIKTIVIVGGSVPSSKDAAYRAIAGVTSVIRIVGPTRYETSAQLADYAFPAADSVILTTGENYPDALGGIALAAEWNAPLLLTHSTCIPASVRTKMFSFRAYEIYLLGSNNTLSLDVENHVGCV